MLKFWEYFKVLYIFLYQKMLWQSADIWGLSHCALDIIKLVKEKLSNIIKINILNYFKFNSVYFGLYIFYFCSHHNSTSMRIFAIETI